MLLAIIMIMTLGVFLYTAGFITGIVAIFKNAPKKNFQIDVMILGGGGFLLVLGFLLGLFSNLFPFFNL